MAKSPKEKTIDRRIRRTRRLLKQGLAELMLSKPFNSITVKEITNRMDLNRSTFYLHYKDMFDLLKHLQDDTFRDIKEVLDQHIPSGQNNTLIPVFQPLLAYIYENRDICRPLFNGNINGDFLRNLHEMMYEECLKWIPQYAPALADKEFPYLYSYITYGLLGMIQHWFRTNMETSQQHLLAMADAMTTATIDKMITQSV